MNFTKKLRTRIVAAAALLTLTIPTFAAEKEVTVGSLKELLPYLKKKDINLVMTPGTYRITEADAKSGVYNKTVEADEGRTTHALLFFEGDNNTYDFTGVTIEVESAVANAYGSDHFGVHEIHIIGNNNVIKNLKLVDVGEANDFPVSNWLSVVMDGANNRLDGVEIRTIGSKPYGYGEVFGKGATATIRHKKHSAVLVRGDYNHVKDCRIIHRAYGHFLFIQGAVAPTIEGCYIEGEMVSTDQILKEAGTGSEADKIDFKTVFGYKLPTGYTLSTGEDGIRTYSEGSTMIDGKRIKRKTSGKVTVKDCVVKHARGGVALTLGAGSRYVENCTLIGCQEGFSVNGGGRIVNCRADAEFGPAFWVPYANLTNITADITIMPYEGDKFVGNGSGHVAFIQGKGHKITLKKGEGLTLTEGLSVDVGGDYNTIGQREVVNDHSATNGTLINETGYPVKVGANTSYNTIITNGDVSGNTSDNTIEEL